MANQRTSNNSSERDPERAKGRGSSRHQETQSIKAFLSRAKNSSLVDLEEDIDDLEKGLPDLD